MRATDIEMKVLFVCMASGIVSVIVQNIADDPLGGHAGNVLLWLFSGVIVAAARQVAERSRMGAITNAPVYVVDHATRDARAISGSVQ